MPGTAGPAAPNQPVEVDVTGQTPQVFAYRLWSRVGAGSWNMFGEGSTGDTVADHYQVSFQPGLQIYYWVGVAGRANSNFALYISLGQGTTTLPNGVVAVTGQTNDSGVARDEDYVNIV